MLLICIKSIYTLFRYKNVNKYHRYKRFKQYQPGPSTAYQPGSWFWEKVGSENYSPGEGG